MKIMLTEEELNHAIADYVEKKLGVRTKSATVVSVENWRISIARVEVETDGVVHGPG
jgi:hypothetical protein